MKIGIVTLPLHTNYGGILQAYALQTVLERMGHEVEHLQPEVIYPKLHSIWKMPFVYCKRAIRKYLGGELKLSVFLHPQKLIRKNTDKFIVKHIKCRYIKQYEWNDALLHAYNVIVFGSDQIWRPLYACPLERYFGDFIKTSSVKRFAYAASFGIDVNEYSYEQMQRCSTLLSKFDAISVREQSAVSVCEERFGVEATHVLDPTLLLDRNDYISLIQNVAKPLSKETLGVYVLDENEQIQAFVDKISRQKRLKPFRMGSKVEDGSAQISDRIQPPVEQWLRAFYDAEFIVTDSFHGVVFSILFHKPFICVGNKNRGISRFYSLLNMLGLEERLIEMSDLEAYYISDIDWDFVDTILFNKKKFAISFLEAALKFS